MSASHMLIIGLGFSGTAIAKRAQMAVMGTNRGGQGDGVKAHALDLSSPDAASALEGLKPHLGEVTHLVMSVAPDADGDLLLGLGPEMLAAVLPRLEWIGYLSTVGVYGDNHGAWVDENSPLSATSKRGTQRILAERQWQAFARDRGVPLAIFRLAGIYGPARSTIDKLKRGKARAIVKPGQVFNRIHVADIAQIVNQMAAQTRGGIYNICDDLPAQPHEVTEFAAKLLDMPPPPRQLYTQAEMTPMARSFYDDNKRISNLKVKQALGYTFAYPTFVEGLKSLLD